MAHPTYRWVGVRMDSIAGIFSATTAAGILYGDVVSAGNAGFALSRVLNLSTIVFFAVSLANMLEVECETRNELDI